MTTVPGRPQRVVAQPSAEWSDATRAQFDSVVSTAPGAKPVNLPGIIAHHPTFLGPYLEWAKAIALHGVLPARTNSMLALRTAWHRRSAFEWGVHASNALARALLTTDELAALAVPGHPHPSGWSPADMLLVRAADELCTIESISDDTWSALAAHHRVDALLEIPFVVGHYTMLSMVANVTGVPPLDDWPVLPASPE